MPGMFRLISATNGDVTERCNDAGMQKATAPDNEPRHADSSSPMSSA
jgi:hypothetical protein